MAETVTITAESPLIDVKQNAAARRSRKKSSTASRRAVTGPASSRRRPGANSESRAGGFQIDGSSGSENRFIVDGMDRTNLRTGTSDAQNGNATVLVDFLDQVQVKSSGYAAEYGGATGGVISAITKSGSNQFRGSVGTYYRNNDMQSDSAQELAHQSVQRLSTCTGMPEFVATPDTSFDNWNPLGDLGGPVLQNRLWFYFGTSYNRTDNARSTTFRNSPAPYVTKDMSSWSDANYYNWNGTTQLSRDVRLRVSGSNSRSANRGSLADNLQPDGSTFADGTPTNGFNTATWDADPEKFKDRWDRTGANGMNDTYAANVDWVVTPKFFVNLQSGYYVYDTTSPAEFAGPGADPQLLAVEHLHRRGRLGDLPVPGDPGQPAADQRLRRQQVDQPSR